MTPRERLDTVFIGQQPDHTPILGGWIACPEHICRLTSVSLDEFWANPVEISIRAYRQLGSDGLIDVCVPQSRDDYRIVDKHTYKRADCGISLEQAVAQIGEMPSPEEIEAKFDFESQYYQFSQELIRMQKLCGEMLWMPAQWNAGAKVSWYNDFGYEIFFCIIGMYSDYAQKLIEVGGAQGRCNGRLVARAVKEGLYPRAVLLGEDICSQRGPMVSPDFLEKYYAPALRYGLEPLLEVGCKPVWHCDGDVRQILDMVIDCGVQGLQGFQPECEMTLDYVLNKRTRDGKPLLIFGPLSVTTELPVCSPEQIKAKIRQAVNICKGRADLVIFTANTINPDVPLSNIIAMHEAVNNTLPLGDDNNDN
jgi:hypothetical protein